MTWTAHHVRARYNEAAATERFLPRPMTASGKGFWPARLYDEADRAGWDDAARADHQTKPAARAPAAAIAKHQQCLDWTSTRISDPMRRHLIWGFAFCRAYGRDFGRMCSDRGWARSTAYHRLDRLWDDLASGLITDRVPFAPASDTWLEQEEQVAQEPRRLFQLPPAPAIPLAAAFMTERAGHTPLTPEYEDQFADFLEKKNAANRVEQARIEQLRRKRLGLSE